MNAEGIAFRSGAYAALLAVMLSVLAGCRAPIYHLAIDRPLPGEVVFRVDDRRPTWERKYYLGGKDDKLLKNAANFIPVERIDPSPWELIRQQVETRFANCGARTKSVVLEVRSCRIVENFNRTQVPLAVLNNPATQHTDVTLNRTDLHRVQYSNSPNYDPSSPWKEEEDGDGIFGDFVALVVMVTALHGYRLSAVAGRHTAHWLHLLPGKAGPPSQIDVELYPQGVTFELEGDAVVTFIDGSEKRIPVRSVRSVFGRRGEADAIKRAVLSGVDETADSIVRQSLGLPPIEVGVPFQNIDPAGGPPVLPLSLPQPTYEAADSVKDEIRRIQQSETERNARLLENLAR